MKKCLTRSLIACGEVGTGNCLLVPVAMRMAEGLLTARH